MTSDHEINVDPFADNDDNVFEHESANGDNELSTENVPLQDFEAARINPNPVMSQLRLTDRPQHLEKECLSLDWFWRQLPLMFFVL